MYHWVARPPPPLEGELRRLFYADNLSLCHKAQEGVDEKQNEEYYNKYSVHHQNLPQEEKGEETIVDPIR